ncbi:MAG: hypothetical protein AAGA56_21090 [Myxococcota bacterium]
MTTSRSTLVRRGTVLTGAFIIASTATGCGFFKSLFGQNTVDLEGAQIEEMSVDIRKERKTICPRERVQLAVFLKAKLKGEDEVKQFETWAGEASHNDKLEFRDFTFLPNVGRVDDEGWYYPPENIVTTIGRPMEITTVYRPMPDKFTMAMDYKPDYRCVSKSGRTGQAGRAGQPGADGAKGESGRDGDANTAGAPGGAGAPGTDGTPGEPGLPGPQLEVYVTMASTAYYERLVAVKVRGDAEDFALFPPEQEFVIVARGGDGGPGGRGGRGGAGGRGGDGSPGGNGGNGAHGGNGAPGGMGGAGGQVRLVLDPNYPELARKVKVDVAGGRGGGGGMAGEGGTHGWGGGSRGKNARSGTSGSSGKRGSYGSNGLHGADGRVQRAEGNVASEFDDIEGLNPVGESTPASPKQAKAGS